MSSWGALHERLKILASSDALFERLAVTNAVQAYLDEPDAILLLQKLAQDNDLAVRETAQNALRAVGIDSDLPELGAIAGTTPRNEDVPISLSLADTDQAQRSEVPLRLMMMEASEPDTDYPIPQANSLDRVCVLIAERQISESPARDSASYDSLSPRQRDYYKNAIGFLRLDSFRFRDPERILERKELSLEDFVAFTSTLVSRHRVIRHALQQQLVQSENDSAQDSQRALTNWASDLGMPGLSEETLRRRRQTTEAWTSWVANHLQQVRLFEDGTRTDSPAAVDLTPIVIGLLGALKTTTTPPGPVRARRRLKSKAGQPHYAVDEFQKVFDRLGRFRQSGPPTLDDVGAAWGLTRERIRQIEKKFSTLVRGVIETDGIEAVLAISSVRQQGFPIDLARWTFESLKRTSREAVSSSTPGVGPLGNAFLDSASHFDGPSPSAHAFETLGIRAFDKLQGNEGSGVTFASLLLRGALLTMGYESGRSTNHLWVPANKRSDTDLLTMTRPSSGTESRSAARLQRIMEYLSRSPMRASELAVKLGEDSPNALREFMRRQPQLTSRSGVWSIRDPTETQESFRSIYDAVVLVLDRDGPATMQELNNRVAEVHPVSYSRLQQALDDHRIGRFDNGRIGLISQGARRPEEKEPKIPPRLLVTEPRAELLITVNKDHLRGSGFQVPNWLGWRLGLRATPESAGFSNATGDELRITRRGGQCYASSIRNFLGTEGLTLNCSLAIRIHFENRDFAAVHLCAFH